MQRWRNPGAEQVTPVTRLGRFRAS